MGQKRRFDGMRVRAVKGPLRGATWPLELRLTIGRGNGSDIQIVDGGVSRQHAHIVLDPTGHHELVDLESRNGTRMDGLPVSRSQLELDAEFEIRGNRFVYERAPTELATADDAHAGAGASVQTFRATMDSTLATTGQGQGFPELEPAGVTAIQAPPQAGAEPVQDSDDELMAAPIEDQDQLLDAIFDYRALRTQAIQGLLVDSADHRYFRRLEEQLREVGTAARGEYSRFFQRFACMVPAEVRPLSGQGVVCTVADIGIDGAKIEMTGMRLQLGEVVWLAVERTGSSRWPSVVLTARVAWTGRDSFGLEFSGKPGSDSGVYNATTVLTAIPIAKVEVQPPASLAQRLWSRVVGA